MVRTPKLTLKTCLDCPNHYLVKPLGELHLPFVLKNLMHPIEFVSLSAPRKVFRRAILLALVPVANAVLYKS
jgi:hypothetical protein